MKTPLLAAAVLMGWAWPVHVSAIELTLEENKAERGSIGFVDTQRLFKLFPETIKAKENFEEAVRQAEDQINLRKAEVLRLRKEIDSLKVEREALAKATPTVAAVSGTSPSKTLEGDASRPASGNALPVGTPPIISTRTAAAVNVPPSPALRLSTAPTGGTAPAVASTSTSTTAAQPLVINLPGATTGPVVVAPPVGAAPVVSTAAAQAVQDTALAALNEKIAQKTRELERKKTQARDEQEAAEKNLLDLESRKSEILLGRIYKAVQEVARRESISVVVDKTGILYGHNAVDLTDKVLKYLKGG